MNALPLSRRDFLKLSGTSLLGALLAEFHLERALAAPVTQARTTLSGVSLYSEPSYQSKVLYAFNRDQVVDVVDKVAGDLGNPYNNIWFQIDKGYAYSGWLQPVETHYQKPVFEIPASGQLGEITVPYSDSRVDSNTWSNRGYRVYYATTHWVTGVAVNRYEKTIWYKIYDSQLQTSLYVSASDMRMVPDTELTPLSPDVAAADKHIYVDISTQSVTAFEGNQSVLAARCSSGGKGTRTPLGNFATFHKGPTIHMTNDGEVGAGHGYDLPGVPWVSFFTGTGDSFHGTYWHNDYGQPRSHGCVNLLPADAKFIYLWTLPQVPSYIPYLYKPGEGTAADIVAAGS